MKNKSKLIIPIISLTIGGGEIVGLKVLKIVLDLISESKRNKCQKIYSFVLLPLKLPTLKLLNEIITCSKDSAIIKVRLWRTKGEFIKYIISFMSLIHEIILDKGPENTYIIISPVSVPECVLPTILAKMLISLIKKSKVYLVIFVHGTTKLLLFAFKVKRNILSKIYALLQLMTYYLIKKVSIAFSFLPIAKVHDGISSIPYPLHISSNTLSETCKKFPIILFMGRLNHRVKGVFDALLAYIKFINKYILKNKDISPNNVPYLIIAGDGPDKNKLIDIINKVSPIFEKYLGKSFIKYLGFVKGQMKSRLLNETIICILPSRFEGFPIVVSECIAHGVRIIAYKAPWVENYKIIGLYEDIITVPWGNIDSLANAIDTIVMQYRHSIWRVEYKDIMYRLKILHRYYNVKVFRTFLSYLIEKISDNNYENEKI